MAGEKTRRPADTAFMQQRLPACQPILTPLKVTFVFLLIGIPFVIIGWITSQQSGNLVEMKVQYDGHDTNERYSDCRIKSSNEGAECTITFTAKEKLKAPIFVYYQLTNYYQNHRRYVKSYSQQQLLGCINSKGSDCDGFSLNDCEPLKKNGSLTLNPCGLIANSLFNDKIVLQSSQSIKYTGIAWDSDFKKYKQPDGFRMIEDSDDAETCLSGVSLGGDIKYASCSESICSSNFGTSDCKAYYCAEGDYFDCEEGTYSLFYYPRDEKTQYLYETFPEAVSPLTGVNTERFMVWQRTAALPKFRKLHAKITDDVEKGEVISFSVEANFDVNAFRGTKSIVVATSSWFGGKNGFLGTAYMVVGSVCLASAVAFFLKHIIHPRELGSVEHLR